jgi:hypothetical protein
VIDGELVIIAGSFEVGGLYRKRGTELVEHLLLGLYDEGG